MVSLARKKLLDRGQSSGRLCETERRNHDGEEQMAGEADAVIVGAGLAGLVAAAELADRGKRVVILDQEGENSLGGQAFWSLGGLFFVDSPEQRLMGIRDTIDLARQDWFGSAAFDRPEDHWPRRWAEAYLDFAAGEKRNWLHRQGMRWFPVVGWAERGGSLATGHGNSVPRFHVTWGTGPGVLAPFLRRIETHVAEGRVTLRFRHRVDRADREQITGHAVLDHLGKTTGVRGDDGRAARHRLQRREAERLLRRRQQEEVGAREQIRAGISATGRAGSAAADQIVATPVALTV